ncbi:MAG: amylosucrase [Eudoraea sp.]
MNQTSLHKLLACHELENIEIANTQELFDKRFSTNLSLIQSLFFGLYGEESINDSFPKLMKLISKLFKTRPSSLKKLDLERLKNHDWYQSQQIVAMQLYVDRFNNNLKGLKTKLTYLENLGINLLHIMPINTRPNGANDGGYAVNSYTEISKEYGSKKDLLSLIEEMHSKQMYLMMDFVVNHTSDEFIWAEKAKKGEEKYQSYYYTFPNREIPDAYEQSLPEVFPESAPGNFTFNKEMNKWVMTVFNNYQWDLNYRNPEVFMAMLTNLVSLANYGVDVVRFDALAFLWKKLGSNSQNLPEAHNLISLFRMCLQTIAPGVIFLAEAIVSPKEIIKYFGEDNKKGNECEIAYNATLMALLWNSIATKKTSLLYKSLINLPSKPKEGTWINYIRCHDDIGLGFEDKYIYEIGWDAYLHRKFLLDYYSKGIDWSPAVGEIFMFNPKNGDGRITGSAASLLGLERGIKENDSDVIEKAVKKIVLLHSIILSFGGIPMLYAGDEIGTLNDYSFLNDPGKKDDSRWLNRPMQNWALIENIDSEESPQTQIYKSISQLIAIRKNTSVFADRNNLRIHSNPNPHLFIYERTSEKERNILIICNFDEHAQIIESGQIESLGYSAKNERLDLVTGKNIRQNSALIELLPFQFIWLSQN